MRQLPDLYILALHMGEKPRGKACLFSAYMLQSSFPREERVWHMDFWLNQALGLLGSLIVFISVQVNNRRVILAAQALACLMWIVHYGLLGAMTAATINILSFARSVVFYFNDRKWAKSRAWLWAFLALYVVNTVLTWDGPRSLLPGIAMSMTTIALWTRDMRRTRLLYLTNSPFWFTYDILARSYSCMIIEAIAFEFSRTLGVYPQQRLSRLDAYLSELQLY